MANLYKLANQPSLIRLRDVDTLVAASTDGADARADAIGRLSRLNTALEVDRQIIDAGEVRLQRRPPIATPTSLQDLVRAGRRRLERERLGGRRTWFSARLTASLRLKGVLES